MPVMYNTGDWFTLRPGNTYRKIELYNFDWPSDIDMIFMDICGAPFGGPIAVKRDSKQIVPITGSAKPIIRIFNAAGSLISVINWKHGNVISMGWTDTEDILCVQDDGQVIIYDMFGNLQYSFNMDRTDNYTKVIDAKIFSSNTGTGVAVMTHNFRVLLINNVKDVKNRHLPEIPKSVVNPTSWQVATDDRASYCLIAREKNIFKLVEGENMHIMHSDLIESSYNSIVKMSVSYNHRYLALCTNNGIIWLGTADMKKKFCEFDTGKPLEVPKQIEWCMDSENSSCSDAVIVTYASLLLIINTNGDMNMYTYDPAIFLIPELDGVRVLTNYTHEFIQKVPKCVKNIFAINSQEPASFLFEANKKFEERSHQSDEYLSLFKGKMDIAVKECIEAAGYEFDPETQKSLIKAAYFGKRFLLSYNPDDYIKMCRRLRVLNALRSPKVGLPLTYTQFCKLKSNTILDRLVFRKYYAIAIQIAKHLKLPESRILEHWAFYKILHDKNDDEVARKITEKFKNPTVQGVSFCNIADKAFQNGRTQLAIKLLELEPKPSLQVPLLLKLKEHKKALLSATKSGNTDLVYKVLFQLKLTTDLAGFQMNIQEFPMAKCLCKKYYQMYNKPALEEILKLEDDHVAQAELALREGVEKCSLESQLPVAVRAYNSAHCTVEAELCSEVQKILKHQQTLSNKYGKGGAIHFYGLSIHDTLLALLRIGDLKLAEKFKNEYKIPDKRYWWARIQILSETCRWEDLEKFSKSKKSPIGYEPFVEVCLARNNIEEAKKYLPKCRDNRKSKLYIRAGMIEEAATIAFEQRDTENLWVCHMNAGRSNDTILVRKIEDFLTQLSSKK